MTASRSDRRVVLVTGGGNGIGAAVAAELGRRGDHVVTVDPLVSVDGSAALPAPEQTTAAAIVAAGGSAEASHTSVTDRDAVHDLVARLVETHGRVDALVNVAGITRPTGFARGEEEDWASVLAVHLDGYRNMLDAVLGHMATAGSGHVLGVTSGSGWRPADAGAYSCAKRAVAALTWQLGRAAPHGVSVNAVSPIAMTRMVAAAMGRRPAAGTGSSDGSSRSGPTRATGGLALGAMPEPDHLAPLLAHLVGPRAPRVQGQVLFAGGTEVAVVDPPRLLEVVRTTGVRSVGSLVRGIAETLAAAESTQRTGGGANPRLGAVFDETDGPATEHAACHIAVVADRADLGAVLVERLRAAGAAATSVTPPPAPTGFGTARDVLDAARTALGGLDAVVVARDAAPGHTDGTWETVLASHATTAGDLLEDAAWARAAADCAAGSAAPLRLVTVTDAVTPGGRSRAQAVAQLARAGAGATADRVSAFAVAVEGRGEAEAVAALVGELAMSATAPALAGAELVVGGGWIGVRSHPAAGASIVFGGPEVPDWFDEVLEEQCR